MSQGDAPWSDPDDETHEERLLRWVEVCKPINESDPTTWGVERPQMFQFPALLESQLIEAGRLWFDGVRTDLVAQVADPCRFCGLGLDQCVYRNDHLDGSFCCGECADKPGAHRSEIDDPRNRG